MKENYHFFKVPHSTVSEGEFKKMSLSAQKLFFTICQLANLYAGKDGYFYRSINNLAKDSGLSVRTVMRAKKELLKNAYIDCKAGQQNSNGQRNPNYYKINGFILKLEIQNQWGQEDHSAVSDIKGRTGWL